MTPEHRTTSHANEVRALKAQLEAFLSWAGRRTVQDGSELDRLVRDTRLTIDTTGGPEPRPNSGTGCICGANTRPWMRHSVHCRMSA